MGLRELAGSRRKTPNTCKEIKATTCAHASVCARVCTCACVCVCVCVCTRPARASAPGVRETRQEGPRRRGGGGRAYSHESVVDERPAAGSLQHVVQVVLQPPVLDVTPAALAAAVGERLPQQAHPGALLAPPALPQAAAAAAQRGRAGAQQQQPVAPGGRRVQQRPGPARLHILHAAARAPPARRRRRPAPHPEPGGAALLSARVLAGHGITAGTARGAPPAGAAASCAPAAFEEAAAAADGAPGGPRPERRGRGRSGGGRARGGVPGSSSL